MKDTEILEAVEATERYFGPRCGKYSGALTVEIIRRALQQEGVLVSPRDVFIRGIPVEVDLILPRKGVVPRDDLVYEPQDVLMAVEVKKSGSFGDKTIEAVRRNAETLRTASPWIICSCLVLSEREGYCWALTDENATCKTYTMFWHRGEGTKRIQRSTGDWKRFLADVRSTPPVYFLKPAGNSRFPKPIL